MDEELERQRIKFIAMMNGQHAIEKMLLAIVLIFLVIFLIIIKFPETIVAAIIITIAFLVYAYYEDNKMMRRLQ
jgi:hypothetical protein